MFPFKNVFFVICTITLFSCQSGKEKNVVIRFPKTYQLTGKSLNVSNILGRPLMFKIKENKLILRDNHLDTQITIIDLDNPENYIYTALRGEGPGELINPSWIISGNDGFFIFDTGKMSLFNFNIREIQDEKYMPQKLFTTQLPAIITVVQLTDSLYIATGLLPENRFYFINHQGEVIAQNGFYPFGNNDEYPFHVNAMASLSLMEKSPKENKIVTAAHYGGHIGIYEFDIEKLDSKTIHETSFFSPKFTTYSYDGAPNFMPTEDTRWGYISLSTDNNYIYALYSGKLQRPNEEFYTGSSVHVFHWDGRPAYEIMLDNPAYRLDIYQNKLYTLYMENDSFEIAIYELP